MSTAKKVNYLNNKDILKEIHKSKMSFCWVEKPQYDQFDIIVDDVSEINAKTLQQAKENQANRIQAENYADAMAQHDKKDYRNKPKQKEFAVDPATIADTDVVFRVMTYEHIPDDDDRKKTPKTEADTKAKVNFPPFKHYAYKADGELHEVARSHWNGPRVRGKFDTEHGRLTNKLGQMFMKLVERYSHRSNWRGYTYVDEMRGQALLQLSFVALKFNEAKSDNPFAYYTAAVNNSFTQVLNLEKRNQTIRDDILIDQGMLPSYSRQLDHEKDLREMREAASEDYNE